MDTPRCPSRDDLGRLLDEQLPPADLRRVSAHVAACPACQQALDGLTDDSDPSLPSLHGLAADPPPAPSPDFLDRLKHATPPRRVSPDAGAPAAGPEADAGAAWRA
jgi:anti-sigma factor RsiW